VASIKSTARRLGLDGVKFDECIDSGRYYNVVLADVQAGEAAGVGGTPALFVNSRYVEGAVPFADLATVIETSLSEDGGE